MKKKATIEAISYWLPENKLSNTNINALHPEWSIDKISLKTGIFKRGVSKENQFTSDIAVLAANKLFKDNNIDRSSIDYLILCTQSPDYLLPTTACIVQQKLGLKTNIGAFDFNLGCSGYIYGLSIAKGFIFSGSARNVLLITAEMYTKYININDKSNLTIFGDASSATLIKLNGTGLEINDFVFGTDGKGCENLIVRNGGLKNRYLNGFDEYDDDKVYIKNDNNLYMNGREIFNFTAIEVPKLFNETLLKNDILKNQIDFFLFHQANKFILDFLKNKLSIDDDKFFLFLENCGNTVSSTIPIALKELINKHSISNSNKILLNGFGVGYSWAGTILGKL